MKRSAAHRPRVALCQAIAVCALLMLPAVGVRAQGTAKLSGTVFDSTEMRALPGARVAVLGTSAITDADADGHFELSGIPAGAHWVSFFHPRLQTLGVSAPSRQVTFPEGASVEVELAVPSERTLLMGWCMAEQEGAGYAALAGVVTDSLTGVPLPRAIVTARLSERRPGDPPPREVRTDEGGYYRLCTVPAGRDVLVQARFGRNEGRATKIKVAPGAGETRDLVVLLSAEGTLVGKVLDYVSGLPLTNATISVIGTGARQVTDSTGGFVLEGLPPGRHLVTTEHLGYEQRTDSVTVFSQETVDIEVRMATEAIEMEGLLVTARTRFGRRSVTVDRRLDVFTRSEIEPILVRTQNMGDLLRNMNAPGLNVREVQVTDATGVVVPGLCVEVSRRSAGSMGCNQATILVNDMIMPNPDQVLLNLDPNSIERIEILSPIDAQFQYGQSGANGAILIYTR